MVNYHTQQLVVGGLEPCLGLSPWRLVGHIWRRRGVGHDVVGANLGRSKGSLPGSRGRNSRS